MPGRRKDLRPKSGLDAPGADKYNPSHGYTKKRAASYGMGSLHRDGELPLYKSTPGVGTYEPTKASTLTKNQSAAWVIGN